MKNKEGDRDRGSGFNCFDIPVSLVKNDGKKGRKGEE